MPSWLPTLIFVPLIGFVLYRRYKRTFGQQRVDPGRIWFRIVLFSALAIGSTVFAQSPLGFAAAGVGAVIGVGLALVGLRHTTYENVGGLRFYTTKPWVGIAVSALFLGRLVARLFSVYTSHGAPDAVSKSPLTLGIFCVVAAYYVVFSIGVLQKSKATVTA